MFRYFRLFAVLLWLPVVALAQSYPDYQTTDINDFAGLLTDADLRDTLKDRLVRLRQDTGIEMTVVTLPSQSKYAPDMTLEAFATGLFNHWGIGDATRNDGILVLVMPNDRAMRIELGAGYGRDWDRIAQRVVDDGFLPFFRDDNYQAGIMTGSVAVIEEIALPFSAGSPPPSAPSGNDPGWPIFAVFGTLMLFFAKWTWVGDLFMRLRTCPQCGAKGTLRVHRRTLYAATRSSPGRQERTVTCTNCDYHDVSTITLPRKRTSSGSSGGFGGGRSGGGGASGRW
ncbi:MAG: TPM domain-containing protein [Pseudomonadota bacterium]